MVANIFVGLFARGHWISNLNSKIGRGHEIIIAFGEDSIGPKHRFWCVMTTWSCNFDKSQYRQLRMGYHYEFGQQVHLLKKNPLGTSCQLLVTCVCMFILFHLLVSSGCTTSVSYVRSSDQRSFVVSISWVLSAKSVHLCFLIYHIPPPKR